MSMTEEVAEESVLESQGHLDIESSSDPSMDISSSPEERDHWHCDEKEIQENNELTPESKIADKPSNENEHKTFQEERKKKSDPALSPTGDKKSMYISRPVNHQATTVRLEEQGTMRVLVDAGYRAMAVHILGEMGLDNVDGAE